MSDQPQGKITGIPQEFKGGGGGKLNIIKHRGDPTEAITLSGHTVTKQEYLYFTMPSDGTNPEKPMALKAAEYHMEHFLYVDPLYGVDGEGGAGHGFGMCTCGSYAVMITAAEATRLGLGGESNGKPMGVCFYYTRSLANFGEMHARHATSDAKRK